MAAAISSGTAYAHDASPRALPNSWTNAWWLWLGLVIVSFAYTLGQLELRRRMGAIPRGTPFRGVAFALFVITIVLALLSPLDGKLGYGVSVVFVFATALHTGALGALISLARAPWYRSYELRTPSFGIDALADQQLAGLIMWVVAGVLFTALALALFAAWLGEARRRSARTSVARLIAAEERSAS